jgi:hypothetical protein
MSSCAAGANTGGEKIAMEASAWIAVVTINGQTTPFII